MIQIAKVIISGEEKLHYIKISCLEEAIEITFYVFSSTNQTESNCHPDII
jgi:hypothetical protein